MLFKKKKKKKTKGDLGMSQTTITLLFLAFAIVSFILEKIPLGLTASICALGLTLTGILDVSTTFSQYVNSNVILCVGMFVVGQALFETGMANKIGGLVTRFAKTEKTLIIAIMVIVGVMSGFLSNTGTAAVLIPVVCGIADESGYSRSHLLMPLVFAAALGGNLSIIGAPGNLMGVNALQEMGIKTSFFMYAPIGIPMLLIGILYFVCFGYKLLTQNQNEAAQNLEEQKDFSNVPKWKQIISLVVLIVVIFAMIFEELIGISIQLSACLGALFLVLTGVLTEKEALNSIENSKQAAKHRDDVKRQEAEEKARALKGKVIQSKSDSASPGNFPGNLCTDQLYVKYSHYGTYDSDRCFSCKQPWSRPAVRCDCNCYRRFLRVCNTNWYACKHDRSRTRRQ